MGGGGCPEKPHLLLSPPNLSVLCGILARALQVRLGSPGLGSSPKLHFPCHYGKGINLGQSQSGGFYNLWGAALSLAFLGVPKNPPLPFFLSMENKLPSLHLDSKAFPGLASPLTSKPLASLNSQASHIVDAQ